jgi:hypothetical protein
MRVASLLLSMVLLACGCDGSGDAGAGGDGAAGPGGGGGAGGGGAATTASEGGAGGGGAATTTSGGGAGGSTSLVPSEPAALFTFLSTGAYKSFAAETSAHPSSGPHSGAVRVYLDPILEASLAAGNTAHPKGAASIKELSVQGGEPGGWAVFVKTEDSSDGGDGFYWYEIFNTTDGSNPPYSGNGIPLCANCHAGGADYYLSAYPLQ